MKSDSYDNPGTRLHYVYWNLYPLLSSLVNVGKEDRVLDAGCGEGKLRKYLKSSSVYGFDYHKKSVEKAKKENYLEVDIRNIYETKYKTKVFDKTFCVEVFPYLKTPEKAFEELRRVTKKELIIAIPNFKWLELKSFLSRKKRNKFREILQEERYTDAQFLKELARKGNLRVKIVYLSNKYGFIRNLFGNWLASEVVGVYSLPWTLP